MPILTEAWLDACIATGACSTAHRLLWGDSSRKRLSPLCCGCAVACIRNPGFKLTKHTSSRKARGLIPHNVNGCAEGAVVPMAGHLITADGMDTDGDDDPPVWLSLLL